MYLSFLSFPFPPHSIYHHTARGGKEEHTSPSRSFPELVRLANALSSHLHLLVRLADQDLVLCAACGDVGDDAIGRLLILLPVELKAKTCGLLDDALSELRALLTNAAGEDEGIDFAAELEVVAADIVEDFVDDEVKGELAVPVALVGLGADDAEIRRAGQGLPSALLVQDLLGLGDVHALCAPAAQLPCAVGEVED